jgi:hypothetical protein
MFAIGLALAAATAALGWNFASMAAAATLVLLPFGLCLNRRDDRVAGAFPLLLAIGLVVLAGASCGDF